MTLVVGTQALIEDEVVWRIAAGSSSEIKFTLWQDAAKTLPADLSGLTGRCELRTKAGGPLLATATVSFAGNVVTVALPASASEPWSAKIVAGVFDAELVAGPDVVTPLCSGTLDIRPNITTGLV